LTGIRATKGVPIGCLTSKLISNVALASLDDFVRQQPGVRYYARYVDDMLLVADASSRSPATAKAIARQYLPLSAASRVTSSKELQLDSTTLKRQGCRFRLQTSKLRGYVLIGRRGRDFLSTVERDVKLIASERRAFLLPDGLGTESPLTALFVGSDHNAPVQVLREVDRVKVERYAASVAIGKTAVGVELLDDSDAARWCKRQLSPLAGHMTNPEQWLEFIELALRGASVCIRASDTDTARFILRRNAVHFNRLSLTRPQSAITWNEKAISWSLVYRGLRDWYQNRILEEVASALPLSQLLPRDARRFVRRLLGARGLRVGNKQIGPRALAGRAELLFESDLRTADRETDLQSPRGRTPSQSTRRWTQLNRTLRTNSLTAQRATQVLGGHPKPAINGQLKTGHFE
jgi:hypothetical protein